jgi:hypothetical protein
MAVAAADQVTYLTGLTVATGGVTVTYGDGALLPAATAAADLAARAILRSAGLTRMVTVATSAADFNAAAIADAQAAATPADAGLAVLSGPGDTLIANY